jgi:antitoxin VapB
MSLNIKDPEVHEMAREIAAIHGISMTGAVREALREKLDKDRAEKNSPTLEEKRKYDLLMDFANECALLVPEPIHSWDIDAYLYDEDGLPK